MARVGKRSILQGIHGQIGDQVVLRKINGQQVLAMKASYKDKPTRAMLSSRYRFRTAVKLSKQDIADPVKRARLETIRKDGQSVFNVAMSENMIKLNPGGKAALLKQAHKKKKNRRKNIHGIKVKNITLLIDTDHDTLIESNINTPDQNVLEWICAAAKEKTSEKVNNIVIRIRCA